MINVDAFMNATDHITYVYETIISIELGSVMVSEILRVGAGHSKRCLDEFFKLFDSQEAPHVGWHSHG